MCLVRHILSRLSRVLRSKTLCVEEWQQVMSSFGRFSRIVSALGDKRTCLFYGAIKVGAEHKQERKIYYAGIQ